MSGPQAEPVSADRVTAARRIAAPAQAIFLLVSDPARHVDIDGSGMLQAAPDASPLTAVGQTFDTRGVDAAPGGVGVGVVEDVAGPVPVRDWQHEHRTAAHVVDADPGAVVGR